MLALIFTNIYVKKEEIKVFEITNGNILNSYSNHCCIYFM